MTPLPDLYYLVLEFTKMDTSWQIDSEGECERLNAGLYGWTRTNICGHLFAVICICAFPLNLQGLLPVQSGKGG